MPNVKTYIVSALFCLPTITDYHRLLPTSPDLAPPGAPYSSHRCYCGKHRQKTWERHALTIVGGRVALLLHLLLHPAQPLTTVLLDVRRLNRSTTLLRSWTWSKSLNILSVRLFAESSLCLKKTVTQNRNTGVPGTTCTKRGTTILVFCTHLNTTLVHVLHTLITFSQMIKVLHRGKIF